MPTPDGPSPIDVGQIDPALAGLLGSLSPEEQAQIFGGSMEAEPLSLPELLVQSSMTTIGRRGLTGEGFKGELPAWASDLAPEVLGNPDFDPYFGIVSEQGDERVYWGQEKLSSKRVEPDVPLSTGMARPDGGSGGGAWDNYFDEAAEAAGRTAPKEPATGGEVEFRSGGQRPADQVETPGEKTGRKAGSGKGDKTLTTLQAMNLPYTWDEEEIAEAMKKMRQSGIPVDSFDMGSTSLVSVWGALVERASMTYAMSEGRRKVTPWDVLDMYKSEAKAAGSFQNYQNGERTTTQRSITNITEGEAWSMLRDNLSRMLGRDPSDQEVREFSFRMNQLAAKNPSITETVTRYKNGEPVSSETETEGGFTAADVQQQAYEEAQNDPQYAEYQAATTYFNSAISALGAIGQT